MFCQQNYFLLIFHKTTQYICICSSLTLDLHVITLKNLLQEVADLEGDTAAQYKISQELEELEERANELDRRRTNNISSIR